MGKIERAIEEKIHRYILEEEMRKSGTLQVNALIPCKAEVVSKIPVWYNSATHQRPQPRVTLHI